jgi:3'-5' exoribonuclease
MRTGRSGSDFLVLTLQDVSAQITAKIFDDVARFGSEFEAGEFVRMEGKASVFNGQLQLIVSSIRRVHVEQDRREGFREDECVLSAPRPIDEMWAELNARVGAMQEGHLRVLVRRILADHEAELREWPAAQAIHHAYRGGFLEHIVKMAEVGEGVSRAYSADADLVLAGVVLHDIGKLQELIYEAGTASYTRDGNLIGHHLASSSCARQRRGFRDSHSSCAHNSSTSCSHHGSRRHGSPVEPKTIEAFILATVDELDAKINQVRRAVREDAGDREFTGWHKRLGRVLYKGGGG